MLILGAVVLRKFGNSHVVMDVASNLSSLVIAHFARFLSFAFASKHNYNSKFYCEILHTQTAHCRLTAPFKGLQFSRESDTMLNWRFGKTTLTSSDDSWCPIKPSATCVSVYSFRFERSTICALMPKQRPRSRFSVQIMCWREEKNKLFSREICFSALTESSMDLMKD